MLGFYLKVCEYDSTIARPKYAVYEFVTILSATFLESGCRLFRRSSPDNSIFELSSFPKLYWILKFNKWLIKGMAARPLTDRSEWRL